MTNTLPSIPSVWALMDQAMQLDGARAVHLAVGRPPMVRLAEQGIHPLNEDLPVLTGRSIAVLLAGVVDPERWIDIERVGEGEVVLLPGGGGGAPVTMTVFRCSEAWSAVIKF